MHTHRTAVAVLATVTLALPGRAHAQHVMAPGGGPAPTSPSMWSRQLGGWRLTGMAQAFPALTVGAPGGREGSAPRRSGWYLTQPVAMTSLESRGGRLVLRTTLDLEGLTQPDGELTFGGWGEGFLDKRHPHTLIHELMVSLNGWDTGGGSVSVSAGRGFAPYGTEDPMSRPGLKYPTNHHLSQIPERWVVSGAWARERWSVEAGAFAGAEPDGAWDLSNFDGFGRSWSARVARGWGAERGPDEWQASVSHARLRETRGGGAVEHTRLWNGALRHSGASGRVGLSALVEGSLADAGADDRYFSVLGEARVVSGAHQPYLRLEHATRPEYPRDGAPGTDAFFRYDHDAMPLGSTRWLIVTAGYAVEATRAPGSVRPFVEVQRHGVRPDRGTVQPVDLFGARSFWAITAGARIFLGGDPMPMGRYGVLDAVTSMGRSMASAGMEPHRMEGR